MKISRKLVYQYVAIFFNFSLTSNHFHPLQVANCDSNSRLVVDKDDYGKLRLERAMGLRSLHIFIFQRWIDFRRQILTSDSDV